MYHRPNAGNIYRPNTRDMFLNLSRRVILKYAPTQSQTGNAANNTENCIIFIIIFIIISFSVCMFFILIWLSITTAAMMPSNAAVAFRVCFMRNKVLR